MDPQTHYMCRNRSFNKNSTGKPFIHFNSFSNDFRGLYTTNYVIFPFSMKKYDLFDSSTYLIHIHTICFVIEVSTKNRLQKQFIHFDNYFTIFVGYRLWIMRFFSISVNFFYLFDSSPNRMHRLTISVGIEVYTKIDSKNNLFFMIFF
jgi:hypothetical protein